MKALSIWQPHASLLVLTAPGSDQPFKLYETRSWPAPRWLIGRRFAVHASKNVSNLNDLRKATAFGSEDGNTAAFLDALHRLHLRLMDLPLGAVVGSVCVDEVIPTEKISRPGPFGDFSPGRYAWKLSAPLALQNPIPCVGRQGFFDVPESWVSLPSKT